MGKTEKNQGVNNSGYQADQLKTNPLPSLHKSTVVLLHITAQHYHL
jgi:hypothetical protein